MIKRLKQLQELSKLEWKVLGISLVSLPTIALLLHIFGYNKTKSLLSFFMPQESQYKQASKQLIRDIHIMARMVHIAARYNIFKTNCLKQALLLWFLLGRKNIQSDIKFGVATDSPQKFSAHAWVECNGEPLIDSVKTLKKFKAF